MPGNKKWCIYTVVGVCWLFLSEKKHTWGFAFGYSSITLWGPPSTTHNPIYSQHDPFINDEKSVLAPGLCMRLECVYVCVCACVCVHACVCVGGTCLESGDQLWNWSTPACFALHYSSSISSLSFIPTSCFQIFFIHVLS